MSDRGVAFTAPDDGDMRGDLEARRRLSDRLGIAVEWATVEQVHGFHAVRADRAGSHGRADALVTTVPNLPTAVFTADCLGVVLHGPGVVGVAHAGWRGLRSGVLESTAALMEEAAGSPQTAHLGPAIGPCCYEVGEEVAVLFPGDVSRTTWGGLSVDLAGVAGRRLEGVDIMVDERCTACGGGPSHRRDATSQRMAAIGWLA